MSWRLHSNALEGRSVSIGPKTDLSEVPEEFTCLLRDDHRQTHNSPEGFFAALANRSRIDGLRQFYLAIAAAGGAMLQIHTAEPVPGHLQTDVLFRIRTKRMPQFGFRLPDLGGESLPIIAELQHLYELIDGTVEGDVWESGGIEKRDSVGLYVGDIPLHEPNSYITDDEQIDSFYRSDTGDHLFASKGKAVWLRHEDGSFVEAGDLAAVIDGYFSSLIDGSPWLSNPYELRQ